MISPIVCSIFSVIYVFMFLHLVTIFLQVIHFILDAELEM